MYHQITRNKRNSVIVIIGFLLVWLLAGAIVGLIAYGGSGAIVGAVILLLLGIGAALFSYYFGSSTVLAAVGAKEADPRQYQQLYNIVQALAIGDGLPMPKVYVMNDPSPNAFATGRDPNHASVTVTTGLLQMMNREELEGVIAHEMSHVKNYDVRLLLVVTTMIGLAALIASMYWNGAWRIRTRDARAMLIVFAIGLIFTIIAFLVGPLMQLGLSRQRESLADVSGVELTRNPQGLISALRKIAQNDKPPERFNHAVAAMMIDNPTEHHGRFSSLFDTHPPIEERIAALEKIASVQQT